MRSFMTFVYRCTPHYICSEFDKKNFNPFGWLVCGYSKGFLFCTARSSELNFGFKRPLVQVNCVLDECKPHGQVVVFVKGFFFCFLFSKVLNTFFFPFFSFSKP